MRHVCSAVQWGAHPSAAVSAACVQVIRIQPNEGIYMKINNKVGRGRGQCRPGHNAMLCIMWRCLLHGALHASCQPSGTLQPINQPALCPLLRPLQVPGLGLRIDTTRLDLTYKSKYDAHLPGERAGCNF